MSTSVGVTVWHRGMKSLHALGGPNRAGSHGQIFFSARKKSASVKWVFPVRDERSNLPAEAVERQAISSNRMKTKDKGGRPGHAPDDRGRQMVELLSGFGIPQDKIADVIGVDGKTLRKHYATELQRGAATVEAKLVGNLLKLASGSDGTALKAITFALQCRFGWSLYASPPPEPKPLGKKEQLQMEAETAHAGNSWGELLQ